MILIERKYRHYINIDTSLNFKDTDINYNIHIVYYINCQVNNNYFDWLVNQINLVKHMTSNIYIVSTIAQNKEEEFRKKVLELFPNVYIECYYENEYEYRGILKVWELGQTFNKSNDIFLYFHSKGVTHNQCYNSNKNDNYNIILQDIEKIKEIFTIFPNIDKIGYFSGGNGWIWYNFWYARGSYINTVEKPIKTNRRHYYEDWLGRQVDIDDKICENDMERSYEYYKNTLTTCYGFYTDNIEFGNIGSYYNPSTNMMYNL